MIIKRQSHGCILYVCQVANIKKGKNQKNIIVSIIVTLKIGFLVIAGYRSMNLYLENNM